jgi:23S rRNA pseudouridine2605 synthase
LILAGRVKVDGRVVTELGTRADARRSRIEVDGKRLVAEQPVYLVLHKPRGVVSTLRDPEGRRTVAELVRDVGARVVPVGRLDYHTSGVLLMTNDGDFASRLSHPRLGVPKVYVVKVKGQVKDSDLEAWRTSIPVEGKLTRPAEVRRLRYEGDKTWLEITLREGKNRQLRRLGEETGFPVMRLARLSHAGIDSARLRPGQWRYLSVEELMDLKKAWAVPRRVKVQPPKPAPARAQRAARVAARSAPARPAQKPRKARTNRR